MAQTNTTEMVANAPKKSIFSNNFQSSLANFQKLVKNTATEYNNSVYKATARPTELHRSRHA